jgi:hypothetical protein
LSEQRQFDQKPYKQPRKKISARKTSLNEQMSRKVGKQTQTQTSTNRFGSASAAKTPLGIDPGTKGLLGSNSPMCTLSQNGYGESCCYSRVNLSLEAFTLWQHGYAREGAPTRILGIGKPNKRFSPILEPIYKQTVALDIQRICQFIAKFCANKKGEHKHPHVFSSGFC